MSLGFPLSVWSRNFCFFSVSEEGKGLCFCCVFCPLSREGNSGLHSTPSNYSSFYGITLIQARLGRAQAKADATHANGKGKHRLLE